MNHNYKFCFEKQPLQTALYFTYSIISILILPMFEEVQPKSLCILLSFHAFVEKKETSFERKFATITKNEYSKPIYDVFSNPM